MKAMQQIANKTGTWNRRVGKIAWHDLTAWAIRAFTPVFDGLWARGDFTHADRPRPAPLPTLRLRARSHRTAFLLFTSIRRQPCPSRAIAVVPFAGAR